MVLNLQTQAATIKRELFFFLRRDWMYFTEKPDGGAGETTQGAGVEKLKLSVG